MGNKVRNLINLEGKRIGKLWVIKREKSFKDGHSRWLCRCDCGKEKIFSGKSLRGGKTKDCGCGEWKKGISKAKTRETLCWTCGNVGKSICSWDKELKPVDGWEAEESKLWNSQGKTHWVSYCVISCPLKI